MGPQQLEGGFGIGRGVVASGVVVSTDTGAVALEGAECHVIFAVGPLQTLPFLEHQKLVAIHDLDGSRARAGDGLLVAFLGGDENVLACLLALAVFFNISYFLRGFIH